MAGVPGKIVASFTLRTLLLWMLTRVVYSIVASAADAITPLPATAAGSAGILPVAPVIAVGIAGVVVALVLSDVRAMRERAFLANLGLGLRTVSLFVFACAITLETALALVLRVAT